MKRCGYLPMTKPLNSSRRRRSGRTSLRRSSRLLARSTYTKITSFCISSPPQSSISSFFCRDAIKPFAIELKFTYLSAIPELISFPVPDEDWELVSLYLTRPEEIPKADISAKKSSINIYLFYIECKRSASSCNGCV